MDSEVDELTSLMNSCPKWVCGEKELVAYKNAPPPIVSQGKQSKTLYQEHGYPQSKKDEGMILKTQVAWKNEVQKK